jgi:uncharacterized Zn finger protein
MTDLQGESREWWVERWLELLDSYRFKKRLERARTYAKEGNVLNIEFVGEQVLAAVQGSEPEPYQVSLSLVPFSEEDWQYVINSMTEKAIFSAQLLAGQMPDDIERVFIDNGLSLFPFSLADVQSRCSCPDKANPCKHIGAVYYQLGDRFSEDPFVIFQLRGRSKAQILADLRQQRTQSQGEEIFPPLTTPAPALTVNFPEFWHYTQPLDPALVVITPAPENKTPLSILGNIPLPYAEAEAFKQYLTQIYPQLAQKAAMLALQQSIPKE